MKRTFEEQLHVHAVFYFSDYRKQNDGDVLGVFYNKEDALAFRQKTFTAEGYTLSKDYCTDFTDNVICDEDGENNYGIKEMIVT